MAHGGVEFPCKLCNFGVLPVRSKIICINCNTSFHPGCIDRVKTITHLKEDQLICCGLSNEKTSMNSFVSLNGEDDLNDSLVEKSINFENSILNDMNKDLITHISKFENKIRTYDDISNESIK